MKKDRKWWDNEARLKALGKGHNSPFNIKNERLAEIVKELQGASKMHLKQSKEIDSHIDDMESPLDFKGANSSNSKCWPGFKKVGTKISPSGTGETVNDCERK